MSVLVRDYHKQAERRESIAALITKQISARWSNGAPDNTELQALVASLLEKSGDGAEFNAALSKELEVLCSIFTPAAPNVGSRPAAKVEQSAAGSAGGSTPKTVKPQSTNPNDTVEQTLQAKLDLAEATINGEDPSYPIHINRLLNYHRAVFSCNPSTTQAQGQKDLNKAPDDYNNRCIDETDIKKIYCVTTWDKTAKCSRSVFVEVDRRNDLLATLHQEAKTLKADAEQTRTLAALQQRQAEQMKDALSQESLRGGGFYGLYAGPSFLLQDGGNWKSGAEIYANFITEAFDRGHCPGAWMCRAYFDASFVTPDAFPSEVENNSTSPIAVFDSKGRLRIRGAVQLHWTDWLGAEAGVGLTSPISDQNTSVRAEPRAHIGAHFQTAFPDLAVGEVFLGYARDKSWERLVDADGDLATTADQRVEERFDRLILDGTLLFPRVELGGFSLGVRLSADVPWSGDTQSEIRGSILLYYPFNEEFAKYRPKVKQAETAK